MCYLYEDGGSRYENCRPKQGGALAQRAASARQVRNASHSFAFGGGLPSGASGRVRPRGSGIGFQRQVYVILGRSIEGRGRYSFERSPLEAWSLWEVETANERQ